ncbi:MAG: MBL fold metallo-hydrolase [Bryobacteraceae bacterium]
MKALRSSLRWTKAAAAVLVVVLAIAGAAHAQTVRLGTPQDLVRQSAEALGGRDRVMTVKTLVVEGAGINPNVGQNPTPDSPLLNWRITDYRKTFDLQNRRVRIERHRKAEFAFSMFNDVRENMTLDGTVAYNIDEKGMAARAPESAVRERRMEMLLHPLAIVREALDPKTRLATVRKVGNKDALDIVTADGDRLTLFLDPATHLPASVQWLSSSDNLGDIVNDIAFTEYESVSGLKLPKHFVTKIDFRDYTTSDLRVSKNTVDAPANVGAAAAVKASMPPLPPPVTAEPMKVASGVWWVKGSGNHSSALYEFADHMTLYEAPSSAALAREIIAKARAVIPSKPVTEVIISHHHFDHTGGLRTMVAEGFTIISHKGNQQYFRELVSRKATLNPDQLAKNPKPLKFRGVEDHAVIKDSAMEVELFRVKDNEHSTYNLVAWVPKYKLLSQSDLFDFFWHRHLWGDNYIKNLENLKLRFEKDIPVHGKILTYDEEVAVIRKFDTTGRTDYTP